MKNLSAVLLLTMAVGAAAQQQVVPKPTVNGTQKPTAKSAAADQGARAFQANCSRCHSAPEQIRRSITHTVLMHMRVRASLSEADEKALLQFLAP